jgi:hypothetical protein
MLSHIEKVRGFVVTYNVMDTKSIDLDVGGKTKIEIYMMALTHGHLALDIM